jgi:lipopolysaccharide export system permease protein
MTLMRYLSRVFFIRFLAVLLALSALVELLEMLDAMRQLVGSHFTLTNVLIFSALRFPLALEQLFLLAVLIGATLVFRMLAQGNEMIVLRGSGMSPYRLLACLTPITLLMALFYFALVDRIAPMSERIFAEWWHTVTTTSDDDTQNAQHTIWLRRGDEIVSIGTAEDGGRTLHRLTRHIRDDNGLLLERIRAASARSENGVWRLRDVEIARIQGGVVVKEHRDEMDWTNGPTAENIEQIALPTLRQQSDVSRKILAGQQSGNAGAAHYRTLIQKSYCAPFLPFLMLLLAVPALAGSGRRSSARGMSISISLGLLFLISNGFLASMSEAEVLPAAVALWTAPLVFFLFAAFLLLRYEE